MSQYFPNGLGLGGGQNLDLGSTTRLKLGCGLRHSSLVDRWSFTRSDK